MDTTTVLGLFDREMREHPDTYGSDRVEIVGHVTRVVGEASWISYSQLDASTVQAAIDEQTEFFRQRGTPVEWKVFEHDRPPDLGARLRSAGYLPDPTETLMAFDLTEALSVAPPPKDVEVRQVRDLQGLATAVEVSREAFGTGRGWELGSFSDRLSDPTLGVFVAYAGGKPVSAGRLELPTGRAFASLWGGGTAPEFRERGIYRALVAARSKVAREHGFRYLTVDALPTSRPILQRLGFAPLTRMTGWVYTP